jgi:molybdopterin-guanine dinucleotide biosynthesis adapter protein
MRVIGLAGWSGAGKTTLIVKLIPYLREKGLSVSTVKHAHHAFDVDKPGKDSYVHREAGASEVLISSANRWVLMHELRGARECSLRELLPRLSPVDLLLLEGFKTSPHAKLEIHRAENAKPYLYPHDPTVVGLVSDAEAPPSLAIPHAPLNDVAAVALLILSLARPLQETIAQLEAGDAAQRD